jgi:HD-GYP domain-containing protein (c-di-GMP phosphodiesterase class II)
MSSKTNRQRALLGEKTLGAFHKLIQTAKIHQNNNQLLIKCIKDFFDVLSLWWADDDELTIKLSHGRFLIQDEKLFFQRDNAKLIQEMYQFFECRELSGLRFHSDIRSSSYENILGFARLLNEASEKDNPLAARKTYAYALTSVKEVAQKINSQKRAGVRKLKRIAQNMVDVLSEDESVMLGISTMRDYDDYTYAHSVNVAILSLCLGKRIGLSRISLSYLAICGLVHDLGKLNIPKEILNKPGKLTDEEFKEMKEHPIKSVSQIMKMQAPEDLKAKILLPPFEHHLKFGYCRRFRCTHIPSDIPSNSL